MELKSIPSAIQSGLSGLQQAQHGLADAAHNIANLNTDTSAGANSVGTPNSVAAVNQASQNGVTNPAATLTTEAVNLVVNEHLAKANIKTIQTADEVLGTLIDTKA